MVWEEPTDRQAWAEGAAAARATIRVSAYPPQALVCSGLGPAGPPCWS